MVKYKSPAGCRMREVLLPSGRRAVFRTALDDSDLRNLPQGIGCHGTKASEMRFFETGDGIFEGHGVVLQPSTVLTLQQLFSDECGSLGICIKTAYGSSCNAFIASGYKKIDKGDYPLILMAKNQSPPYFIAAKEDILSAILPSGHEMAAIIRKARNFLHSGPQWRLALAFSFVDDVASLLVQKIIGVLEKLAR